MANTYTDEVIGLFEDPDNAEDAINELRDRGYAPEEISVVGTETELEEYTKEGSGVSVSEGTGMGAASGAVLGGIAGLLAGVGAIAVPPAGALLFAGPLAVALGLTGAAATTTSGAASGALAGGIVGGLVSLGFPEEKAKFYEEKIGEGSVMVSVPIYLEEEQVAREILEDNGADDVWEYTE
ncbi:low temperature-induced protein [Candidatus Woesearchaeota archaeon]|nr:low temperature-induced protein [Candidatus Woesearchaeota archaeon]